MREFILAVVVSFAVVMICLGHSLPYEVRPQLWRDPIPEIQASDLDLHRAIQDPKMGSQLIEPAVLDVHLENQLLEVKEASSTNNPTFLVPLPQKRPEIPSRLERARKYLGTNPTGWAHLWCARFMAMIEPPLAKKVRNPNLARDWADLPKVPKQVGAIVVLTRRGGGHIGIITKILPNGDLMVLSGNHGHKVAEGYYSKNRILAIVG